eukprot:CAMPEP_0194483332 /NCGR_PEP_ID=MMETSP0253-20130528/4996_1 /TAXON_ID=2966 /ORGANISM="Noctiluca scintillans" /LENGTH=141 /DNA_ID=CAMNT_0039322991 /DNA_START=79 /DNA_END=505 /DNA_ORIENTATION=-
MITSCRVQELDLRVPHAAQARTSEQPADQRFVLSIHPLLELNALPRSRNLTDHCSPLHSKVRLCGQTTRKLVLAGDMLSMHSFDKAERLVLDAAPARNARVGSGAASATRPTDVKNMAKRTIRDGITSDQRLLFELSDIEK